MSGSALLEEIDELPGRRSSYIATIPWSAMRWCGGGCTMNYNTISAQRIAGALGAEIAEVDLSRPLSDEVIGEIRQALLDHQVIFFHDQHLTPEQNLASRSLSSDGRAGSRSRRSRAPDPDCCGWVGRRRS